MCQPYRYIDERCGHPVAPGWHDWVLDRCRVALFTGRDCWIPANVPPAMVEDRVWEGDDKPCLWCPVERDQRKQKTNGTGEKAAGVGT
ncbi:PPIC-type PPIASE domain-containing protein [Purpureocillium lavendulum]|uniref:PPIC-type PPIASE domain-containing protein n=1 Tax=Purpureocillium lavendulum TaxID=1247861 RepID=A0AB34FYC2_9HYPO|nr:PPIC-type PPIASE domain-containing protein [Purpureocillium lavendulum]